MNFNEINKHMKNKFSQKDKVETLTKLPNKTELEKMDDNKIYQVQFSSLAINIVDFKKMSEYTDPEIFSSIMSEFTWGIIKILKEYKARYIDIQWDGIFATFGDSQKSDIDNTFNCACMLNSFQNHLQKMIEIKYKNKIKKNNYSYHHETFKFGIGLYHGWKNYISKLGDSNIRQLIYIGESVNYANYLAKQANRDRAPILMNKEIYDNFTDNTLNSINTTGGFSNFFDDNIQKNIYSCNWIINGYENFIKNDVKS